MLPPGVNSWDDTANNNAYLAGTLAFTSNAGTMYAKAVFDKVPFAKDIRVLQTPTGPTRQRLQGSGGQGFYFFDGSKNYEASRQVAEHMLTLEVQRVLWKTSTGYVIPAYANWWDDPIIKGDENSVRYKPVATGEPPLPGDAAWRGPNTEASDAVSTQRVITDMMGEVLNGKAPAQAVREAHDRAVKIYKEFGFKGA